MFKAITTKILMIKVSIEGIERRKKRKKKKIKRRKIRRTRKIRIKRKRIRKIRKKRIRKREEVLIEITLLKMVIRNHQRSMMMKQSLVKFKNDHEINQFKQ